MLCKNVGFRLGSGQTYLQLTQIVRELCAVAGRWCLPLAAALTVTVAVGPGREAFARLPLEFASRPPAPWRGWPRILARLAAWPSLLARVLLEAQCQGWPKAISEGDAKAPLILRGSTSQFSGRPRIPAFARLCAFPEFPDRTEKVDGYVSRWAAPKTTSARKTVILRDRSSLTRCVRTRSRCAGLRASTVAR